jgi:acyl-lipid omega-6 desaturase (Delta-12 desaturase)
MLRSQRSRLIAILWWFWRIECVFTLRFIHGTHLSRGHYRMHPIFALRLQPRSMRSNRNLLIASKVYSNEIRWLSWWHFLSTFALYFCTLAIACSSLPILVRFISSIASGLLVVRLFIIYHDFHHGAILRKSWIASLILNLYGLLVLSPGSVWRGSHEHHHKHNSKGTGINPGSFPLMSAEEYRTANSLKRIQYIASRHWLTIMLGYLTIFLYGMSIRPFISNPKRHWDAGLAVVLHVGLLAAVGSFGVWTLLFSLIVPLTVACGLGSYLFYAQHNFPACRLHHRDTWTHADAALSSSSYIEMNWFMQYCTGNVGFHHVHHLNAKIPFYRLPEAMKALPELQSPGKTTLHPFEIFRCLRLNVWDTTQRRLVALQDAA